MRTLSAKIGGLTADSTEKPDCARFTASTSVGRFFHISRSAHGWKACQGSTLHATPTKLGREQLFGGKSDIEKLAEKIYLADREMRDKIFELAGHCREPQRLPNALC